MLNLDLYIKSNRYSIVRLHREKPDGIVALLMRESGEKFILRMYDHYVFGYDAVKDIHIDELPKIYKCESTNNSLIVEEEFIDGLSLSDLLEVYHPDVSQSAAIADKILNALDALHKKGVIHRDIKPENVLITSSGRIVLIDLDASSVFDPQKSRDTHLMGTAGYAAPEQFGFGRSDARTDLFSLGVLLNVCLTGGHPSISLARNELTPIIEKCIEVNADKRYLSALELKKDLKKYIGPTQTCSVCGSVTHGGGCLCCARTSPYKRNPHRKLYSILAALTFLAIICIFIFAGQKDEKIPALSAQVSPSPTVNKTQTAVWETSQITALPDIEQTAAPEATALLYSQDDISDSKPIRTYFEKFNKNILYEGGELLFLGETDSAPKPFIYDIDGDNIFEEYYFGVLGNTQEVPKHVFIDSAETPSDSFERLYRTYAPAVFTKNAQGEYIPAQELSSVISKPTVELYYIGLDYGASESTMPFMYLTLPLYDTWDGAALIEYHIGCTGAWAIECKATINGKTYTSYSITHIK